MKWPIKLANAQGYTTDLLPEQRVNAQNGAMLADIYTG
jgi:hypothetical protein